MSLREDYRNDKFAGMRKYKLTNNADGTVSLSDVTQYQTSGDIFNADDINATNRAVNQTVDEFSTVKKELAQFQVGISEDFNALRTDMSKDFNNLQTSVNQSISDIKALRAVTLPATGWSAAAPFTQTVTINGIQSSDSPVIALYITGSPGASVVNEQRKAFGYLDRAVTDTNQITFYCYEKKPASNFMVSIKGE